MHFGNSNSKYMETLQNTQAATPESVWAILQEVAQMQQESDRKMKELVQSQKEHEKAIKELQRIVGEMTNDQDAFVDECCRMANAQDEFFEEYFFNSFKNGKQNFFGEKFDDISKKLKSKWQGVVDDFDIVFYNHSHSSVAIIEVKYKARETDIPKVLKKAENFRMLFPQYKDFKVYLGLASLSFYEKIEEECIKQGIAIIKQVGDGSAGSPTTVVINDAHLKVF